VSFRGSSRKIAGQETCALRLLAPCACAVVRRAPSCALRLARALASRRCQQLGRRCLRGGDGGAGGCGSVWGLALCLRSALGVDLGIWVAPSPRGTHIPTPVAAEQRALAGTVYIYVCPGSCCCCSCLQFIACSLYGASWWLELGMP
jgi:hypothetical protein